MPIIRLTITQDDPAAPVDGATLLTLTRADTGAAVPFGSAAFTNAGGGVWTHAFTAPAVGLAYAYTFAFHRADGTTDAAAASTYFDAGTAYVGEIHTQAEVLLYLGSIGLTVRSDVNGTGGPNASAIAQCMRASEGEINSYLSANALGIPIPITFEGGAANADPALKQRAIELTCYYLDRKRLLDGDANADFKDARKEAREYLSDVAYGDRTIIGLTLGTPAADVPIAVPATVNADGLTVTAANVRGYRYVWDEALGRWRY